MASTPSTSLRLELIGNGEQAGSWGGTTNTNLGTLLEQAICGYTTVYFLTDADKTLSINNYLIDESRAAVINLVGTISVTRSVFAPGVPKIYIVKNSTTGGQAITFKKTGSTGVTIPNGKSVLLFFNGSDFEQVVPYFANAATTADTLTGDQTNWATYRASAVANMLGWKNNSNGHVIFDASAGTSPTGSAVSTTDAATTWIPTYPVLMGWNGTTTYGVRVDSAKTADIARLNTFEIKYNGATSTEFRTLSPTTVRLALGTSITAGTPALYFTESGALNVIGGTSAVISLVAGATVSILDSVGVRTNGELGYYGAGTGGVITQITSKSTSVSLNKICGTITTDNASLAADSQVSFLFYNTKFDASDNIILNVVSGTNGAYCLGLDAMSTNVCRITIRNLTAGAIAEAIQIRFTIIKSSNG